MIHIAKNKFTFGGGFDTSSVGGVIITETRRVPELIIFSKYPNEILEIESFNIPYKTSV